VILLFLSFQDGTRESGSQVVSDIALGLIPVAAREELAEKDSIWIAKGM
jgi:hypothetical protein